MARAEFEIGDIVVHRSGGPRMVFIDLADKDEQQLVCRWFDPTERMFTFANFRSHELRKLKSAETQEQLALGDVVAHRCHSEEFFGGPVLVVSEFESDRESGPSVFCRWFDQQSGRLRGAWLRAVEVRRRDPADAS